MLTYLYFLTHNINMILFDKKRLVKPFPNTITQTNQVYNAYNE